MKLPISTCLVVIGNPFGLSRNAWMPVPPFVWLGISLALTIGLALFMIRIKDGKKKRTLFGWYLILNDVAITRLALSVLQPAIAIGTAVVLGAITWFQWRQVTLCPHCGKWINRARLPGPDKICPGCSQPV